MPINKETPDFIGHASLPEEPEPNDELSTDNDLTIPDQITDITTPQIIIEISSKRKRTLTGKSAKNPNEVICRIPTLRKPNNVSRFKTRPPKNTS